MRSILRGTLLATLACSFAYAGPAPVKPPAAPVEPVIETFFGRQVTDNYRYMEALGPDTVGWMKAEGAYTRATLDAIKPLADLQNDVDRKSTRLNSSHRP